MSACSKEEDRTECCFCSFPADVKPRPFDRSDVYQQMQVQQHREGFRTAAVAVDGIPPDYLLNKGWTVVAMAKPKYHELADDARGVDSGLRDRMPDLDSLGGDPPPPSAVVVVGRWYVPFLFVKVDGDRRLKDQVRKSMFYKMTMEQSWEQIYSRENTADLHGARAAEIAVTATVRRFTALLGGGTTVVQAGEPQANDDGAMWFRPAAARTTGGGVALDMVLWERMRWEVERGGRRWVAATGNGGNEERIQRTERRDDDSSIGHWTKFGCYLLVERFVLRRMDGTVALTCEFRHTDKIRARWV